MILAVFRLCRSRTQWSPLLLSLLKDLLDVGSVFLEQLVMFTLLLGWNYWLWTEVPFDFGVPKLVFDLVNVDLSVRALMRAYVHDSHRSLG